MEQLQAKLRRLADEFAAGEINREQFYSIYEHYQAQLNLASAMLDEVEVGGMPTASNVETIMLRKKLTAVAQSAAVYLNQGAQLIETLGAFQVPEAVVKTTIRGIVEHMLKNGLAPEPITQQHGNEWVLYMPGRYSTVIMTFTHEPVIRQVAIVQNMHHDFETANEAALVSGDTKAAKLVFPFVAFVKKSISGSRRPRP